MYISFYTILSTLLFLLCTNTSAQERCLTPSNVVGHCINIKNCNSIMKALQIQKAPLTQEIINFLRSFQCGEEGNDPKVCCPNLDIPEDPPNISNHPNLRMFNINVCGPISETKIVGGESTKILSYPWMALLAYNTGRKKPEFRCGGSLITKRYVLTAAHCVVPPTGSRPVSVRLGEHDIRTEDDCEMDGEEIVFCADKYQDFGVESVHYHPEYSTKYQNDIALIRLDRDVDLTVNNVRPICLPLENINGIPAKVTATGWGATERGLRSPVLLKVDLPTIENSRCREVYSNLISISNKQICAGGERAKDSCSGDSGGPLQWHALFGLESRYVQYGIVSFGMKNCGTTGYPGVYTNVKYYMDWILNTMVD